MGFLRDADPRLVNRVVERRLQTEQDEQIISVLERLQAVAAGAQ
jgi:hypothetical protein